MKKNCLAIFCLLLVGAANKAVAQKCDCIDSSQNRLYLNGDNFTLIDNALRCFKLSSIATSRDSLVRVWVLGDNYPDSIITWQVRMFEFGKHGTVPTAELNILEWNMAKDSSLPVKCIRKTKASPNKGWLSFEKGIRRLNLPILYQKPFINNGIVTVDYGMLIIQFLFGHNTYTVDFTGLMQDSPNSGDLQSNHSTRIANLLRSIEKHFSINLSSNGKN